MVPNRWALAIQAGGRVRKRNHLHGPYLSFRVSIAWGFSSGGAGGWIAGRRTGTSCPTMSSLPRSRRRHFSVTDFCGKRGSVQQEACAWRVVTIFAPHRADALSAGELFEFISASVNLHWREGYLEGVQDLLTLGICIGSRRVRASRPRISECKRSRPSLDARSRREPIHLQNAPFLPADYLGVVA